MILVAFSLVSQHLSTAASILVNFYYDLKCYFPPPLEFPFDEDHCRLF